MAATAFAVATMASAYSQSVAMGEQAKQEELINENNQRMAKIRVEETLKQGESDAAKLRGQVAKFKGTQKASMAASGTDVNFGSNLAVRAETEMLALEDEQRIKNNAALQAWGYQVESVNSGFQAKYKANALRAQAQTALISGVAQAGAIYYGGRGMKAPKTDGNTFSGGMTYTGGDTPSSSNVG